MGAETLQEITQEYVNLCRDIGINELQIKQTKERNEDLKAQAFAASMKIQAAQTYGKPVEAPTAEAPKDV